MTFSQKFRNASTVLSFVIFLVFSLVKVWQRTTETNVMGNQDFSGFEQVIVKRVIDGDTIVLADDRQVRYIGIDTPETVHPQKEVECFGLESSSYNRELVEGKAVYLETDVSDKDRYGRLLRYVWLDGEMVNEKLVREGYAFASAFPPDIKYQDMFNQAQQTARESELGLWKNCPVNSADEINQLINQADQDLFKSVENETDLIMEPALIDF